MGDQSGHQREEEPANGKLEGQLVRYYCAAIFLGHKSEEWDCGEQLQTIFLQVVKHS